MISTLRGAIAIAVLLSHVFISGCGTSKSKKNDDPEKVEEKMKEYKDISRKERNG